MSVPERAGPTLRVDELSVQRAGRTVVHDVSLEIPPGEVSTLLGANGAGKSTLVLAIGGVLRPSSGRVLLDEEDLTGGKLGTPAPGAEQQPEAPPEKTEKKAVFGKHRRRYSNRL